MKATETKVVDFLASNKTQFVIPVYQRNYDWPKKDCERLLNDILEIGSNKKMIAHFIGSIVFIHDSAYTTSNIKELTIIDGQQRLTTITLIYIAIHRLAQELNNESLVNEILDTYLINKYASKEEEKLKLRPTENNDKALKYLLNNNKNDIFPDFSKIIDNFNYFKNRIAEENYKVIWEGLNKLMFVEISLEKSKDDPQRIFESLNSTGLELSQADLIRNYILMGLNRNDQTKIYQKYWEFIEKHAKYEISNISKVSDYIRDYLTFKNKKIPNKRNVYFEFKEKYPITTFEKLIDDLTEIKDFSIHYNKLINPQKETDKGIRLQLEYIDRLEVNVAFPFLIKVYDDYESSLMDKATFISILELIQSYLWRRFILGLPTNALNKIFMTLYEKVDVSNYLFSVQKSLLQRTGTQRFPKDAEVIDALKVKDVYNIKSKNRLYLLERLENHENKEYIRVEGNPDITVEHIFPQTPDPKWKIELEKDKFIFIQDNYLNTIGNLTLSGNNGKLGNKTFVEKRDLKEAGYKDSRLWLNKYLSKLEKWDQEEIEKRFVQIVERFLKIWKYPNININEETNNGELNIFEADDPTGKKLEYAIFFDQKIGVDNITTFYIEIFKRLFELQPEVFFISDIGQKIGLSQNTDNHLRAPMPLNETYCIETNCSSFTKFERIKYALECLDLREELIIKYT
ncbi:MAG: DUF262 domain-containing HNH endonuclease family protein [Planctomycetaceae bacterium]|jgi:uncharacterized protein with ParB-like and HNH nuclease domain|nr:DUF262 domain-containing HNH endonuclease family protein [Planctomycetaceae bacterium]